MGFYQTYLSVTMVLALATLLVDALNKKKFKEIGFGALRYVLMGIFGIVFYYLLSHLFLKLLHMQMSDYSGASSIGLHTLLEFPRLLPEAYRSFYDYFFTNGIILNYSWRTNLVYTAIFGAMFVSLGYLVIKSEIYKKPFNLIAILVFLVIAPLFFGIIEIMVPDVNIHILMACSMILVFPIFFKVLELLPKSILSKACKGIVAFCSILIIWIYIFQDQASYLALQTQQNQMNSVVSRVMTQIESLDGFTADTPVFFFGNIHSNSYFGHSSSNLDKRFITSKSWGFVSALPSVWPDSKDSWNNFLYEYTGTNLRIVTMGDCADIMKLDEFKDMPLFPENGSVKMIDGVVVVKFSDDFIHV